MELTAVAIHSALQHTVQAPIVMLGAPLENTLLNPLGEPRAQEVLGDMIEPVFSAPFLPLRTTTRSICVAIMLYHKILWGCLGTNKAALGRLCIRQYWLRELDTTGSLSPVTRQYWAKIGSSLLRR